MAVGSTNLRRGGGGGTAVILTPNAITIDDGSLSQSVAVSGTETGTITVERGNLPAAVNFQVSGTTITFTGTRPPRDSADITGRFRVTVRRGSRSSSLVVNVHLTAIVGVIMGFEWQFNNSSPALRRLEAAEGLTATAGIGTVAGQSDFDNMPIYKDIRRCNLAANGTVTAYEGETGFNFTTGDVMVEIPIFYYRVENDTTASQYRYFISDQPLDGFLPHPAFARPAGTADRIYVGAYETGAGHVSRSGLAPLVSQTRAQFRTGARGKGAGWALNDFAARMAVTMLMIVEFANLNTQNIIAPGNTSTTAALNTGRTNAIVGTGREAGTNGATVSFVWRGIENWWGNVWEWVDGVNRNATALWISINPAHYADDTSTNYTQLGFTIPTASGFLTRLGFDVNNPWAAFPNVATGGSETTFLCDNGWFTGTGWLVARVGGSWDSAGLAGAFAWAVNNVAATTSTSIGARLLFIP